MTLLKTFSALLLLTTTVSTAFAYEEINSLNPSQARPCYGPEMKMSIRAGQRWLLYIDLGGDGVSKEFLAEGETQAEANQMLEEFRQQGVCLPATNR